MLLFNRSVVDTLQKMIGPDYRKSFARAKGRAAKLYHQAFWWAPGETAPGPNAKS